jgi:hypothetical protein
MPPALAARFTVGELAVLRIVGDEVRARKVCGLHLDAIAARAGVSRSTAKNAIREAKRLGLVEVQERRRHSAKGPVANFFRSVCQLRENAAQPNFWLRVCVSDDGNATSGWADAGSAERNPLTNRARKTSRQTRAR